MTGGAQEIRAPEHLTAAHDVSAFDSGVPDLDDWLRKRALANEDSGASRTYVVCAGGRVVGITRWQAAGWRRCRRRAASGGICRTRCR